MPTMTYVCKKNSRTYVISTDTVLSNPRDIYAWNKGAREYLDNYTADLTLKGDKAWKGTKEAFEAKVHEYLTEAVSRWNAGDLPGSGVAIDFEAAVAAKYGITKEQLEALMVKTAKKQA